MKNLYKNEQSGRSMIEMLGVLAIIGVLSVGGISGYSKAMAKFKLTKAQDQISMILINVRTAFASSPSYKLLTNATAINLNLFPADMLPSGLGSSKGSVVNAFSGPVTIRTGGLPATASDQRFTLVFGGLGKETCASLSATDWGTEGLVAMDINGKNFNQSALPIGAVDATKECQLEDSINVISWEYY